jgi:hypothetical protein
MMMCTSGKCGTRRRPLSAKFGVSLHDKFCEHLSWRESVEPALQNVPRPCAMGCLGALRHSPPPTASIHAIGSDVQLAG